MPWTANVPTHLKPVPVDPNTKRARQLAAHSTFPQTIVRFYFVPQSAQREIYFQRAALLASVVQGAGYAGVAIGNLRFSLFA